MDQKKQSILHIIKKTNFWNKYKNNFIRYFSSNKSNLNKQEQKIDNNKRYKEKSKGINIYKPKLSIFYLKLKDYLCVIRETSFFLIKKYKYHQIH